MIDVSWSEVKTMLDARSLVAQYVELSTKYIVRAIDGPWELQCILEKEDGNVDTEDFETNYKDVANLSPTAQVRTRSEREDVVLKLCRNSGTTNIITGEVTLEFKVPGTYGVDAGRQVAKGSCWFANPVAGDCIEEINVVDKDNILGFGANTVLNQWHDSTIASYQSGGANLSAGRNEVENMGEWKLILPELYLQIKAKKGPSLLSDTFYLNIVWGEPQV